MGGMSGMSGMADMGGSVGGDETQTVVLRCTIQQMCVGPVVGPVEGHNIPSGEGLLRSPSRMFHFTHSPASQGTLYTLYTIHSIPVPYTITTIVILILCLHLASHPRSRSVRLYRR